MIGSGAVYIVDGRDITHLKPHQRAQLGLGIKTQVPSVYNEMSMRENIWLAAYAKKRSIAAVASSAS